MKTTNIYLFMNFHHMRLGACTEVTQCNGVWRSSSHRHLCVEGYPPPPLWTLLWRISLNNIFYDTTTLHKCKTLKKAQYPNQNVRHSIGCFSNTKITVSFKGISIRKVWSPQIKPNIIRFISTLQFGTKQLNHPYLAQYLATKPTSYKFCSLSAPPGVCRYRRFDKDSPIALQNLTTLLIQSAFPAFT